MADQVFFLGGAITDAMYEDFQTTKHAGLEFTLRISKMLDFLSVVCTQCACCQDSEERRQVAIAAMNCLVRNGTMIYKFHTETTQLDRAALLFNEFSAWV